MKDVYCGSDPEYAVPYRFVGEYATHALFAHNMFPKNIAGVGDEDGKRWLMLNVPSFRCDPERDGTASARVVALDMKNRIALVCGRADYCGVVKKSMFTVMNFLLPEMGHMGMHCSANIGERGDGAILFGLSGTGKTTLSADPDRKLIQNSTRFATRQARAILVAKYSIADQYQFCNSGRIKGMICDVPAAPGARRAYHRRRRRLGETYVSGNARRVLSNPQNEKIRARSRILKNSSQYFFILFLRNISS